MKTFNNLNASDTHKNVLDVKTYGNSDLWQLLCKASSIGEGWMKSTKAMQLPGGCLVQVSTQQKGYDDTYAVAEAITYVPNVRIVDDEEFGGRKLTCYVTL